MTGTFRTQFTQGQNLKNASGLSQGQIFWHILTPHTYFLLVFESNM